MIAPKRGTHLKRFPAVCCNRGQVVVVVVIVVVAGVAVGFVVICGCVVPIFCFQALTAWK